MRVLGMMSGTSVDAIDVALVETARDPEDPGILRLHLLAAEQHPWPAADRRAVMEALPPAPSDAATWCRLHARVGQAFADAAAEAAGRHGGADLIAAHGQTIYHDEQDGAVHGTLQIGDAARIAAATSRPVVHDLRAADVARGGQGAPLAPLLDQLALAGDDAGPTAVLNIGGITNVTLVGGPQVLAGDLGPGNALLDAAVLAGTGHHYDRDAERARRGRVDAEALELLLADPFYARPLPRSTGREHFDAEHVRGMLGAERAERMPLPDLLATLTELTAVTTARALRELGAARVVASGGGVRNPLLRERLAAHLDPLPLLDSDAAGIPADDKEALLVALLGYLSVNGLPGTVARADGTAHTGAREPAVLGSLTPVHGLRTLPLTAADAEPVTAVRVRAAADGRAG